MLAALLVVVFLVSHVIGDPVNAMVPPDASEEVRESIRESLGLTGSLAEQFGDFVGRVAAALAIPSGNVCRPLAWS